MQDSLRNQSWIRITFVIIALAAAAAVVIDDVRRSAAGRKLREAILAELQPVALKNCTLKRFGSANDGGYLMCENLIEPLDTGYSYGVGPNDDWGCEVSRRYHVPVHEYDCFDPARPICDGGTICLSQRMRRKSDGPQGIAFLRHAGKPDQQKRRYRPACDHQDGHRRRQNGNRFSQRQTNCSRRFRSSRWKCTGSTIRGLSRCSVS